MSYEFHKNEYSTPEQYLGLMWDLIQREKRSPHLPANKSELINRMFAELFTKYVGADDFVIFTSEVYVDLRNPDKTAGVAAAVAYFNT